ncbi:septum formation family protein [Luteipulveratus halotolerans]|uniref:Septum formation-related domain-containing protein n=1 Tax=Luteipulveratus halotolerans TaxID=1631356 RepID=A0A0L6CGF3_9MICO|nr:septum formation family protein [Luteipulveratus halotolerans]KNX36660.1 hypothetical protein VV01_05055 [Luteipulveratus halotolerans]
MSARGTSAAGLALALMVLATGCDKGGSVEGVTASSTPAGSASAAATTGAAPTSAAPSPSTRVIPDPGLTVGQCTLKETDWTRLACSAPHEYEVTAVVADSSHPTDMLKRHEMREATCERRTAAYLGSDAMQTTHYRSITYPISKDPQEKSRFICMVGAFDPTFSKVGQVTGSVKGRLAGPGAVYNDRACAAQPISPTATTQPAPCSGKHVAEAVGGGFIGQPTEVFPGTNAINQRTSALCTPAYNAFLGKTTKPRTDISMVTIPPSPTSWSKGSRRSTCWVQVKSGQVTKSLKGIGDKPLASYQ